MRIGDGPRGQHIEPCAGGMQIVSGEEVEVLADRKVPPPAVPPPGPAAHSSVASALVLRFLRVDLSIG